jgi:glycosyltransferase involved in cell wall biosynthesis
MSRLNILFISTQLPYPPKSGGTVKSWNYVSFLAKKYQLSVACLLKDDDAKYVEEFQNKLALATFIYEELQVKRSAINLLKSYLMAPCMNVFRNASNSFKAKIEQQAKQQDVIIIDHYEMFQYVPATFKGKVIMHTHNAEFMLWQRMSELEEGNLLKKGVLRLEAARVKKYEQEIFRQADLIYSTPSDIALYRKHGFDVSKHVLTYHLGNDSLLKLPPIAFNETEKALTFIGTLSWEPNIDGLLWFLGKVWPIIIAKHPDARLYVLGKDPDQRILDAAGEDKRVVFTGFIKDLEVYLKKTRVYLAPLRFGSGMKVKVLEGLYRGSPTVSTSVGAEGLEVASGESIFIADTAEAFARDCIHLLENEASWEAMRDQSRKLAASKYRWEPLFEKMDTALKQLML